MASSCTLGIGSVLQLSITFKASLSVVLGVPSAKDLEECRLILEQSGSRWTEGDLDLFLGDAVLTDLLSEVDIAHIQRDNLHGNMN